MLKPIPDYLRLHIESSPNHLPAACDAPPGLAELCRAFEEATGWPLRFAAGEASALRPPPVWSAAIEAGSRPAAGKLWITEPPAAATAIAQRATVEAAAELGSAVAGLVNDLRRAERAVWEREAELAAGVPVAVGSARRQQLAELLESLLESAAEALDCQGAGLYLLDEATTELKLRSAWRLPWARFTQPARPLQHALADLEAMAGHAVALETPASAAAWQPPEDFPAALCVPVSSAKSVLGTLWLFARRARRFSPRETNLAEIVAGRVAAELEREMLAVEALAASETSRQLAAAAEFQREQLPSISPLAPGWEVAGWTSQARQVGGDFHDWFPLVGDRLAVAVGDVSGQGLCAALAASGLRAALRAHGEHVQHAGILLECVNRSLWAASAGDQAAALFCGLIEPAGGLVRYAWAGYPEVVHLARGECRRLADPRMPLGVDPESRYAERTLVLEPGEVLVLLSDGVRAAFDEEFQAGGVTATARAILEDGDAPAATLIERVRARLEADTLDSAASDQAVVIVKRG